MRERILLVSLTEIRVGVGGLWFGFLGIIWFLFFGFFLVVGGGVGRKILFYFCWFFREEGGII